MQGCIVEGPEFLQCEAHEEGDSKSDHRREQVPHSEEVGQCEQCGEINAGSRSACDEKAEYAHLGRI